MCNLYLDLWDRQGVASFPWFALTASTLHTETLEDRILLFLPTVSVLVVIIVDDPTAPTAFSIVTLVVIIEIVPTVPTVSLVVINEIVPTVDDK